MNCERCGKRLSRKTARQIDGVVMCSTCMFAPINRAEEFTCPDCHGEGWTQGTDYEDQCCGGSDWECGASGCTGPIQVQVPIQEQCEYCLGTGDIRARDRDGAEGGDANAAPVPQDRQAQAGGIAQPPPPPGPKT